MNILQLYSRHRLLSWLALLLLVSLISYGQVAAQPAITGANDLIVAGSYAGTVNVTEPAPLGALDLLLEIRSANGVLSGQVNSIKTQVFLGGPTFTGSVTASPGITTTVSIESQTFSGTVSGRTVQRRFVLTGDVLDGSDTLRGVYTETIIGFKPHPITVKGTFLLVRPSGVTEIITVPTPQGSTPIPTPSTPGPGGSPTPTATSTVPPGNSNGAKLYLPLVHRAAAVNAAAVVEENMVDGAPIFTPTVTPMPTVTETLTLIGLETPMPTVTETLTLIGLETPTPTPLTLAPSTVVTTATESQQQILLPLIMQ